eukprot:701666-Prorocentrum_minimum.AAC.1
MTNGVRGRFLLGSNPWNMLSSPLRLVLTPGIFPLVPCDWPAHTPEATAASAASLSSSPSSSCGSTPPDPSA